MTPIKPRPIAAPDDKHKSRYLRIHSLLRAPCEIGPTLPERLEQPLVCELLPAKVSRVRTVRLINDGRLKVLMLMRQARVLVGTLEEAVCQGRFGCSGEESPIDTELFTACLLISTSSSENDGVRQAAERIIARSIEENLFGVSLSSIRDEANLWWGIRLAVRQLSKDKATILSMLPGKEADPVGKAVSIIGLATLRSFKAFKEEEHLHPLDYTPEIYKDDLRSFCFGLQNVLDIQLALSENSIFRRTPHYWSAMDRLDDVVDVCAGALGEKADELNLYLLSHLNRSMVLWLAHARTTTRWKSLQRVFGLAPSEGVCVIRCEDIVVKLDDKPLEPLADYVCNNKQFSGQVKALLGKMKDYVKSASFRHPFTVAICGPPGSGKTHLAKSLLKSLGVAQPVETFNLAGEFPDPSCDKWESKLRPPVTCKLPLVVLRIEAHPDPYRTQNVQEHPWLA